MATVLMTPLQMLINNTPIEVLEALPSVQLNPNPNIASVSIQKFAAIKYTTIFLENYTLVLVPHFTVNSANCSFALVESKYKGKPTPLFVKAVEPWIPSQTFDDIMVDNINGFFINKLFTGTLYSKYFMYYIGSFISLKSQVASGDFNWGVNSYIVNWKENNFKIQQSDQLCNISISQQINGFSLSEYSEGYKNNDPRYTSRQTLVLDSCLDFFKKLLVFGFEFGISHNDLHLGNIFYNKNENCLTMIDYGRLYFNDISVFYQHHKKGLGSVGDNIKHMLQENGRKVNFADFSNYTDAMKQINSNYAVTNKMGHAFTDTATDYICFSGNLYFMFLNIFPKMGAIRQLVETHIIEFSTFGSRAIEERYDQSPFASFMADLNNEIIYSGAIPTVKELVQMMAVGLFLMMEILLFIVNTNKLSRNRVFGIMNTPFYSSFQYTFDTSTLGVFFNSQQQKLIHELQGTQLMSALFDCSNQRHLNTVISSTMQGGAWGTDTPQLTANPKNGEFKMEGLEIREPPPTPFKGLIVGDEFWNKMSREGVTLLEECKRQGGNIRTYSKDGKTYKDKIFTTKEIDDIIKKSKLEPIPIMQDNPFTVPIYVHGGKKKPRSKKK